MTLATALPLMPTDLVASIERLVSFRLTTLDEVHGWLEAVLDSLVQRVKTHGQLPAPRGERNLE